MDDVTSTTGTRNNESLIRDLGDENAVSRLNGVLGLVRSNERLGRPDDGLGLSNDSGSIECLELVARDDPNPWIRNLAQTGIEVLKEETTLFEFEILAKQAIRLIYRETGGPPALQEALKRRRILPPDGEIDEAVGNLAAVRDMECGSDTIVNLEEPPDGDWKELFPPSETSPPSRKDDGKKDGKKYVIAGEVGQGGMGVILDAFDTEIGRDVAMKVISTDLQESREYLERFVREAQVQGQLEHPNICPVHEMGIDREGRIYFTMKMVHGYSLSAMIEEAREEEKPHDSKRLTEILNIFLKICDGLTYAHSRGIIHRDLKPDNIMVGDFGEVYIMDWGLAKMVGSEEDAFQGGLLIASRCGLRDTMKTMTGSVVGTPAYMPPEQSRGLVEEMDERSDIYSLGALLYELLSLEPPFTGNDPWDILSQIGKVEPSPPSGHPQGQSISAELDSIVMKCLQKQKGNRYETVQELKHEIELFLSGRPISAMDYSLWRVFTKWVSRNRALAVSALAVLAVLVVAFAVSYVRISASQREAIRQRDRADEQRALAEDQKQIAEQQRDRAESKEQEAKEAQVKEEAQRQRAEEQRTIAEQQRITAVKSDLKSRLSLARMVEEQRDVSEAVRRYRNIKAAMERTGLNLCPFIDLFQWRARFNQGRCIQVAATIRSPKQLLRCVAFNPQNGILAVGCLDGTIQLINPVSGQATGHISGHRAAILVIEFSPDGSLLAAGRQDTSITIWNLKERKELATLKDPNLKQGVSHAERIESLAFSPDGTKLASCGDEVVKLWDVQSKEVTTTFWGHTQPVFAVDFSPDASLLVSGGKDKVVKLWNVEDGREIKTLYNHWDPVKSVAFSPDGNLVASASKDTTIKVWNIKEDRETATLRGHGGEILSLAFSPDGTTLVSAGCDKSVRFWDLERKAVAATFMEHPVNVTSVAFSPNGKIAASAETGGDVKLWSLDKKDMVHTVSLPGFKVTAAAFSPDGKTVAVGTFAPKLVPVLLIDAVTGDVLSHLMKHGGRVRDLDFSPDGAFLATVSELGLLRIADMEKKIQVSCVNVKRQEKTSIMSSFMDNVMEAFSTGEGTAWKDTEAVGYSPDGTLIATGSNDGMIRFWSPDTCECTYTFPFNDEIYSMAFSPDGALLAAGGRNRKIVILDVNEKKLVGTINASADVRSMAFSPDGLFLAADAGTGGLDLWNVDRMIRVGSRPAHLGSIRSLCYSPDGRLLATGGDDAVINIWDAATLEVLLSLKDHQGRVTAVDFSPDGQQLVSGSRDNTIKIWKFGAALKPLSVIR